MARPAKPVDERRHHREASSGSRPSSSGRPCASAPRGRPAARTRRSKRSARSPVRPIVLPSRMPETESDSSTSVEMSASVPCFSVVIRCRSRADAAGRAARRSAGGARADSREPPVEQEHRDGGREDRRHVGDDRRGRGRDDALDAADVVCDARLHLAGARAREEGEREPLEVRVDRGAEVVHDVLADEVREPGLRDADNAGDDRDRDHPRDQQVEPRRVDVRALAEYVVQEVAEEERGDDAQSGRDHDQAEETHEPGAVG